VVQEDREKGKRERKKRHWDERRLKVRCLEEEEERGIQEYALFILRDVRDGMYCPLLISTAPDLPFCFGRASIGSI
jgi:hypothetical protein